MPAEDIEEDFPSLKSGNYQITSPATPDYNCFAWAFSRSDVWYSPVKIYGYEWPASLPMNVDPATMIELFRGEGGFERCDDGSVESGFEKVALYSNGNSITHAARQLGNGAWTSKLGSAEDIKHHGVELLENSGPNSYGKAAIYLKRRIR